MTIKKFSIYTSIILSVVVVMCVICCFITIPTPFKLNEKPSKITVYDYTRSITGKTTHQNSYANEYEKLYEAFISSTNLSFFERIVSGANIFDKPTYDSAQLKPTWATAKGNNLTIELEFSNPQTIVVYQNEKSKNSIKIEFYALAMVVPSSPFVNEVTIYYKGKNNSNKIDENYQSSPILLKAKTKNLYNIIKSINFND